MGRIDSCLLNCCYSLSGEHVHPGFFFQGGRIWSLGLKACIGTIQGIVAGVIVPSLASKVTPEKYVFTTASNLIMTCLIPVAIIMYLDTGCLGRWAALWKPCRSNRQLFEHRLICTSTNKQDCSEIGVFSTICGDRHRGPTRERHM